MHLDRYVIAIAVLFAAPTTVDAQAAPDAIYTVDAQATAKNVTACIQQEAPACLVMPTALNRDQVGGHASTNQLSVQQCLLAWEICKNRSANIVQHTVLLTPATIIESTRKALDALTDAMSTKFDDAIAAQNTRFAAMIKALGLQQEIQPKKAKKP